MKLNILIFILSYMLGYIFCESSVTWEGTIAQKLKMMRELPNQQNLSRELSSLYYSPYMRRIFTDGNELSKYLTNTSTTCRQSVIYAVTQSSEWTFNMLDATGKPPTSILAGGIHWVGGFDQCMNNPPPKSYGGPGRPPRTHYCRISVGSPLIEHPLVDEILVNMDFCVPEACTAYDVTRFFNTVLSAISQSTGTNVAYIRGERSYCWVRQEDMVWSSSAIAALVVCGIFVFALFLGTFYDVLFVQRRKLQISIPLSKIQASLSSGVSGTLNDGFVGESSSINELISVGQTESIKIDSKPGELKVWEKLLVAFSIHSNTKKIMDTAESAGRLGCLDGIRFLSMAWVILGHTFAYISDYASNAGDYAGKIFGNWRYMGIANGTLSVDSFFTLSGLLTAYTFLTAARKMKTLRNLKFWILFFIHRIWRLTPVYMLVLAIFASLTPYLYNGPFWIQTLTRETNWCPKNWWTNLLYINNLVNSRELCIGWSWYLAVDMQFHVFLAPVVLSLIFLFGKWGALCCLPISLGSMIASGMTSRSIGLVGANAPNIGRQFDELYIKPWNRMHSYLIGTVACYLMMEHKRRNWRLHWAVVFVGWIIAGVALTGAAFGAAENYSGTIKMTVDSTAAYQALFRFSWCLGLAWVMYACITGYGGIVNQFLSWSAFIPLSRITYCAYLVHLVVQVFVYQSIESPMVLTDGLVIYWFLGFMIASYGIGFVACLAWESPFIRIERILLGKH